MYQNESVMLVIEAIVLKLFHFNHKLSKFVQLWCNSGHEHILIISPWISAHSTWSAAASQQCISKISLVRPERGRENKDRIVIKKYFPKDRVIFGFIIKGFQFRKRICSYCSTNACLKSGCLCLLVCVKKLLNALLLIKITFPFMANGLLKRTSL